MYTHKTRDIRGPHCRGLARSKVTRLYWTTRASFSPGIFFRLLFSSGKLFCALQFFWINAFQTTFHFFFFPFFEGPNLFCPFTKKLLLRIEKSYELLVLDNGCEAQNLLNSCFFHIAIFFVLNFVRVVDNLFFFPLGTIRRRKKVELCKSLLSQRVLLFFL